LMEQADRVRMTRDEQNALRYDADRLAVKLRSAVTIVEPEAVQVVSDSAEPIGEGGHPERGTTYGSATIRNITTVLISAATLGAFFYVGKEAAGPYGAVMGGGAAWIGYEALKTTKRFSSARQAIGVEYDRIIDLSEDKFKEMLSEFGKFRDFVGKNEDLILSVSRKLNKMKWVESYLDFAIRFGVSKEPSSLDDGETPDSLPDFKKSDLNIREIHSMILKGEAPPVHLRPRITNLDFKRTKLSDIFPISNLVALKFLNLDSTQIDSLNDLRNLVNLRSLDLDNTRISDISVLSRLVKLRDLNLDRTDVSDISVLENLTELEVLGLNNTTISDINPLRNLTKIVSLELNNNNVFDISPLLNLIRLKTLWLGGSKVVDVQPLEKLSSVTTLGLSSTAIANLNPLKGMRSLQVLYIDGTNVSDVSPLSGLKGLNAVNLDNTPVSDISPLAQMQELSSIWVRNTNVTDLAAFEDRNIIIHADGKLQNIVEEQIRRRWEKSGRTRYFY